MRSRRPNITWTCRAHAIHWGGNLACTLLCAPMLAVVRRYAGADMKDSLESICTIECKYFFLESLHARLIFQSCAEAALISRPLPSVESAGDQERSPWRE